MSVRTGHSLLELLVALTLGAIVLTAAVGLLHGMTSLARATNARTLRSETLRVVAEVLRAETRWLHPLRDVRAWAADSLALRALRASGTVCVQNTDGSVLLGVDALRAPDPAKDSVLILRGADQELGADLLNAERRTNGCNGRTQTYRVLTSVPLLPGDLVLIFEAGAYYLSERALRYRLGREGRQPLTGETLDTRRTFFAPGATGGTAVLAAGAARAGTESMRVRLPFLNQQP
ncbi:MAG: prepilin-type N-terminal cleavage/methylation domain-containing protein [Longimicrobiales bacterium]